MEKLKPMWVCPGSFSFFLDLSLRRLLQKPEQILGEYIKAGDRVIDVGCGSGFFTLPLLQMVGVHGHVTAADLQQEMLAKVQNKAIKANLFNRLKLHLCTANHTGLNEEADFIVANYMVHETPSPYAFFKEIVSLLTESGRFLMIEPTLHVSKKRFLDEAEQLERAGLRILDYPKGKGGHSILATRRKNRR